MVKQTNDIIEEYRQMYVQSFPPAQARLPIPLKSEEDTYQRLKAIYSLEVEIFGSVFLADQETEKRLQKVAGWLYSSHQRGLLLMGNMGSGKSTMLRSIHRLFGSRSTIGDAQEIFEFFKKSSGTLRYWDDPLLLLDDLGVEPEFCMNYGETHYPLTRLLLHRYDRRLTTIIATNLPMDSIQQRYGDRLVDRMYETYGAIRYLQASYRRMKSNQ